MIIDTHNLLTIEHKHALRCVAAPCDLVGTPVDPDTRRRHLILRQRAGLIGANNGCCTQRFNGGQAADQRVAPLRYAGDPAPARARLREVLNGMAQVRIVQSTEDYLHAEFRSAVFGFVDDVEFYFNPPGMIQVRSASRTGYDDFGVNRERVETIRALFLLM